MYARTSKNWTSHMPQNSLNRNICTRTWEVQTSRNPTQSFSLSVNRGLESDINGTVGFKLSRDWEKWCHIPDNNQPTCRTYKYILSSHWLTSSANGRWIKKLRKMNFSLSLDRHQTPANNKKSCCCKVCRKRAIFVGAPNLTTKENCGLSEPKPC